ncbi:hypothetical protein [Mesorhizobium temperatum]|uniref:Uncharacterized protein n=1 Tax=Mesorhizobium temperatum TaxID=241416 RepID=A0A271L8M2_9HYPH|nr:hypothetical protein [Mesorhizobium temperatum]PAQ04461.1 hypothetical protein CIT26_35200 [Mesorhizobium temperatum]
MRNVTTPREAEVIHELPDELAALIGRIMVAYEKLEHKLTMLTGVLLQLSKPEARIVLREPRANERLEMALDLFAIKDIQIKTDTRALSEVLTKATSGRDVLAHGLWLENLEPTTYTFALRAGLGQRT